MVSEIGDEYDRFVCNLTQIDNFLVVAHPVSLSGIQEKRQILFLLPVVHVVHGEAVDALLQVLDPALGCRVQGPPVDQEENETDDDERLDQRGEEEDNPHVVATALPSGLLDLPPGLQAKLGLGVTAFVHGCLASETQYSTEQNTLTEKQPSPDQFRWFKWGPLLEDQVESVKPQALNSSFPNKKPEK